MKKVLLFILLALVVGDVALYLVHSGRLFTEEMRQFSNAHERADAFPFIESVNEYPSSPYLALGRFVGAMTDPRYHEIAEDFYKNRNRWNLFDGLVGASPAYYEPFFFTALGYFLLLTAFGWLQRFWTNASGLSVMTTLARILFVTALAFLYTNWVRNSIDPDSMLHRLAGRTSPFLNQPEGIAAVTALFSAFVLLACLIGTIVAFAGFLGRRVMPRG